MLGFLLDINIVIYIIKRKPVQVLDKFNAHANQLAISPITLAELIHGIEKSAWPDKNRKVVEDFVSRVDVMQYTDKAAYHYGSIRASLARIGQPIGVNDLHIAAHARSEGMVLVTNNTKEFQRVEGLRLENWV